MSADVAETIVIETAALRVSLIPSRGADIFELVDRESGQDTLFKTPWGVSGGLARTGGAAPVTSWFDSYAGGWTVLVPNGGAACEVMGVELPFHGEASVAPWEVTARSDDGRSVDLRCLLRRSPLRLDRRVTLDRERPTLTLHERLTNIGGEPYDFIWAHHPTLGEALLDGQCRIDTSARSIETDASYDPPGNALVPGARGHWPLIEGREGTVDLSTVPAPGTTRSLLAYLSEFGSDAWYAVSNHGRGIGFALRWPVDVFPCAWFWQELNASSGYPFFRAARAIAIEPSTTFPADGLAAAIASSRARTLAPGEAAEVTLTAALFRPRGAVTGVLSDGTVVFADAAQQTT
ncbi:MAG: aldose 1-epimerase [Gaiellales bacterium]